MLPIAIFALLATATAKNGFSVWDTPPTPLLPSQDSFYIDRPGHLRTYDAGEIVRARKAPGNLTSTLNCSAAYNIVFRTTDSNDQPTWAFTTLLAPFTPYRHQNAPVLRSYSPKTAPRDLDSSSERGTALLSFQAAYNTPNVDRSASVVLYDASGTQAMGDVLSALSRGWFVSIPDFEGRLAAFGAGKMEGHAVLDSVKAVLELAESTDLEDLPAVDLDPVAAKFGLWGYSGGSIASLWAAELQASGYQASLLPQFAGVAVGGMVPDPLSAFSTLETTPWVGLLPLAILGITVQFDDERDFLLSHLKPEMASKFLAANNMSYVDAVPYFAGQNISDYFIDGEADLNDSILSDLFDEQSTQGNHGIPKVPVFAYKAIGDEFSRVEDTDTLIKKYCDGGANVLYHRNTVGGHLSEFQNGHTRTLDWLESLFNGSYSHIYDTSGCHVKNVTAVDPTGPFIGNDF